MRRSHSLGHLGQVLAVTVAVVTAAALVSGCTAPPRLTYTYSLRTIGPVHTDVRVVSTLAHGVYADPRGWSLGGRIAFREVAAGGDFTLWLATAGSVPTFSPACSVEYSCTVGRNVIINEARLAAGPPGYRGPDTLVSYRTMVLNHETGHWLGLGHRFCGAPGAVAPVMQQQSISLQGCRANAWPLPAEIAAVAAPRRL